MVPPVDLHAGAEGAADAGAVNMTDRVGLGWRPELDLHRIVSDAWEFHILDA